jgi:hypothetical protein
VSDKWKWMFGFYVVTILGLLGLTFGLGHVEEKTSYGLPVILNSLAVMAGAWAGWVSGKRDEKQ